MIDLAAAFMIGLLVGLVIENYRKRKDLEMDAEREVTFLYGHPYYFKAYDFTEEEQYEMLRKHMERNL